MQPLQFAVALAFATIILAAAPASSGPASSGIVVHAASTDPAAAEVTRMTAVGKSTIERFFGHPFSEPIRLTIAPDRAAFDAALPPAWGMGNSQCWMVGVGVADFLVVLSPTAWPKQSCEHDPRNVADTQRLISHELTHVYHGQHNPTRDFTGADDIGWFVEGLAVVVSGQLDNEHQTDAAQAIQAGAAPTALATAWSGRYRYGVSGSLVRYIDVTYGRHMLVALLAAKTQGEILGQLGATEPQLLDRWKAWVVAGSPARPG